MIDYRAYGLIRHGSTLGTAARSREGRGSRPHHGKPILPGIRQRECPTTDPPAVDILAPIRPARPWLVGHVPHAATLIPPGERSRLRLDDEALAAELLRITDRHTDRLFAWVRELGGVMVVNRVSRLVVDPERFPDDADEPMAVAGQGAVYTRTTHGLPLRDAGPTERRRLLDTWYEPYHAALAGVVETAVASSGRCLLLDGHSFATSPLPSEPDRSPDRPDVCLGTDPVHTPPGLAADLRAALEAEGFRVELDRPFAGTLVPRPWYGVDRRVTSIMLEVRRGTYMDEGTGEPLPGLGDVAARLRMAVAQVLTAGGWPPDPIGGAPRRL
jgi:N-formylglutamate amidohydrolase